MTRKASFLFAILLVFQSITSGLGIAGVANAEGDQPNVFKDISLLDEHEQSIEKGEVENQDNIWVHIDWSTEDVEVDTEDTYTTTLPENVAIPEEQTGHLEADEDEIGVFYVSENGAVAVEFNEKVTDHPDAVGTFVVKGLYSDQDLDSDENGHTEANDGDGNNDSEANESAENADEETDDSEGTDKGDSQDNADDSGDTNENESNDEDTALEEKSTEDDKEKERESAAVQADEEKHGFNLELDEITDLEGEAFDEQHPMDPHQEFKLKLDWDLEDGHNYVEGDTETFNLPKGIKIQEEFTVELTDESGQVVANAVVTPDKKVELTFTDFVEGHSAVSGWMEIISQLDTEEVEEEDGEVIIDPIGEEGELRIPIEKSNKDKTIEKNGTPNKGYNADEINWEVIVNKNKTSLENAKITDELPEGTEYKEGSLIVTKLKVDLDGNILGDGEEVEIDPEFGEDGELIVPLGDTNDAYRVEYVTEVTDDEKNHFENNAKLTDDELDDVSAKSTITINRGESIKKSAATGYDPKTGIIEWEIEFNFNQKDLDDVTLEDAWTPEGALELVEDSLKFQEVTIAEDGNAHNEGDVVDLPEGANLNQIDDGFEVTGISTDKAYKVTYQTKVTDRVLDPIDVSNTAGFEGESDGSGTHVGQYYGAKSAGTVDYAAKTIDWKIEINHDEYPMKNISVEDTLGDGLTLLEDSITITVDGQDYEGDFNLSGDNPFTIDFPEDYTTDKKIKIHYKTEFDADNVTDHIAKNKADITWTPEGEDDSITKEVEAETPLNKQTEDNSWKNGSYNPETKEITWTIYTNYRENDIGNLIVKDEPQENQQIVKDSAVVKELDIAANGHITEGDTVDGVATIDEDANTLEVNIGETSKAYKIEYKTSLEGLDDMKDEYTNQAEIFDEEESLSEIDAKVGVVKDSKYGSKSGYQDGKQVHWSIDVNLVQQKIKDLKLVDSISENQEYLEDTITVYRADIDGNGKASKGEKVPSDDYELVVDQDVGEFTVEWKDDVERAFIVEYSTLFFEKHGGDVRNDYVITGDSIEEDDDSAEDGSNVTISQLGSGGGEGTAGYLVIDKVDATHGQDETSLEGAEFDLIDSDTGNVLKSGVTDENGQIDFGRLLFGDYQLKETKVPEGYVTPEEEQTITIDKAYTPDDDKEGFEYTVENYQPVFAVELSKTDDEGNALEGAEFTLFDAEDKKVETATTDEDGKILFEDLEEAGTYYVQETKAPAGYVLDETKHWMDVGEKEKEPVTVSIENNARGIVKLTKTDQDTGDALEGVEFELQKENDSGEYEAVETYTTNKNGVIKTSNTLEAGNYQFVEVEGLDGYRTNDEPITFTVDVNNTEDLEYTMTNEQYKGAVKLVKEDAATGVTLEGAEFKLVDSNGEVVHENLVTNHNGEIEVDDLFLGDYQLIETKAPEGYELDETPIDIEVTEDNQVIEKTMTNNKITDITVEKQWNNDGGDTEPVTINLLPTDETVELNEDNDWKATFESLDVYDENGEEIEYEVEELDVDGYNSSVTGDASDGFIVTNTETTSIAGTKTWLDDGSDERPDQITVKLLADGEKAGQKEVTAKDEWKYAFTSLDKYDKDGEEIDYTVEEIEVDGYETNVDGFDITNTRTGTIDVTGEKTWKDVDSSDRPDSITVNLTREVDGDLDEDFSEDKTVEPDERGKWFYSFTDLDEFNADGKAYTYLITEEDVSDKYESIVDGYDITNVRVGTTDISGTKSWNDDKTDDRPDTIEVNLLQNDVVIETKEVTEEDDWGYSFTDIDAYDDEGQKYDYTVKEQPVPGYHSEVDGSDITNTRSEKTSIEVTKAWLDGDSEDERPDSITVYLNQNEDKVDEVELTADNEWSYEFTDLEAYDEEGMAYEYTLEEKAVDGYETTIDGVDITNLRVGETKVEGTKTWLDDDSKDRPESIIIHLLANCEETDKQIEVDADSNWEFAFTDLDQYDDEGVEIEYTVEEEEVNGYETTITDYDITNLRIGKTEVTGNKIWDEVDDRYRADSITVILLAGGEEVDSVEVSADTDWSYGFTGLDKYDDEGKEITYTVEEQEAPKGYTPTVDGNDITNTQESTEIKGEKTWTEVDDRYRADSITVQLLANGEKETTIEVTKEMDWSYEFTDLATYDKDGELIEYTVEEIDVPEGYESEVEDYTITNTQKSIDIEGEKVWEDVNSEYRPDTITVQLLANGEEESTAKVSAETDWTYAFTDLAEYDKDGKQIEYTVEELDVPTGYESEVDGYTTTNTQESTEVTGEKTWDEVDSQYRPDFITIHLLANGEPVDTVTVTEEDNWEYVFTDLAKYDGEEEEINYSIEEENVSGYTSEVDGYNVTNTQVTTDITGTKTWLDDDSEDRPDTITVQVKHGDDVVDEVEVTAEDDWTYTFTDLAKYDENGEEINYTVDEKDVGGYEKSVDGSDITNLRVGETEVAGNKTWDEVDDRYRPDAITVTLLANGEEVDTVDVSDDTDWSYAFTDLAKYDDQGKEITYRVEEADVPAGYESEVDGYTITNTQETTEVEGEKTWLDDDAENRPESITVYLLANGDEIEEVDVTADTNWEYKFTELPKFDETGEEINYTVDEKDVDGYEKIIEDTNITNVRTGTTEVSGTKIWQDDDAADRPEVIKVNLIQDGAVIGTKEVTAEDDWTYQFTDLPKYDAQGVAYDYAVTEHHVAGYDSEVDGYDITNTRSDTTSIEVTKGWLDNDSGDRPDSITVHLLQNGETYETVEITAEDDWKHEFVDLDAYDEDGALYEYTVEEEAVDGYETIINGLDITNVRVGTTSVEGVKTWLDDNSSDRPESITVDLLQNGEVVDSTEVTAENDWKYSFTDLEKYDAEGVAYHYTVAEKEVAGYESVVDGFDITNLRVGTTDVSGTKTWVGDEAGERPASIIVELLRDGEKIDEQEVTSDTDWRYAFTDLPKYDENGVAYEYTISEQSVEGYESTVDGYDITNTLIAKDVIETEKSEQPKDDKDQDEGSTPSATNDSDDGDTLPQSATDIYNLLLAGLVLIALGVGMYLIYRRRRSIE